MNTVTPKQGIICLSLTIIAVYLLFVAKLDYYSPRSWRACWDLGHVFIFIPVVYLLYRFYPRLSKIDAPYQVVLILALTLVIGGGVELLQGMMNRSSGLDDLIFDLVGACIAIILFSPSIKGASRFNKIILYGAIPGLILISSWRLITSLIDEYQASREFPLISSLEHRYESSRWSAREPISINRDIKKTGCCSLELKMLSGQYTGVKLQHFPADWSEYQTLEMAFYNPAAEKMGVFISIYDNSHQKIKLNYPGLYSRKFVLKHGWNTISFDYGTRTNNNLKKLIRIKEIRGLAVFIHQPEQGQKIYIDNVRLVK